MPSHYLNQCWDIVDWTLRNSEILIEIQTFLLKQNAFENVVRKMAAIFALDSSVDIAGQHDELMTRKRLSAKLVPCEGIPVRGRLP